MNNRKPHTHARARTHTHTHTHARTHTSFSSPRAPVAIIFYLIRPTCTQIKPHTSELLPSAVARVYYVSSYCNDDSVRRSAFCKSQEECFLFFIRAVKIKTTTQ